MDILNIKNKCSSIRTKIERAKGELKQISDNIESVNKEIAICEKDLSDSQKAQIIAQIVAQDTQGQLEIKLNKLVSMALEAVFEDEAYKMLFNIEISHGKTIIKPYFERDGVLRKPGYATGFGPLDVAEFALKPTLWSLEERRKRPIFVLDEPGKAINDPTGELNKRFANIIHDVAKKLDLQIIIITQDERLCSAADKVFKVKRIGKYSKIIVKEN